MQRGFAEARDVLVDGSLRVPGWGAELAELGGGVCSMALRNKATERRIRIVELRISIHSRTAHSMNRLSSEKIC